MYRRIIILTATACALAACGASSASAPAAGSSAAPTTAGASTAAPAPTGAATAAPTSTPAPSPTAKPADTAAPAAEQPEEGAMPNETTQPADEQSAMVALATQDLAKRLSTTPDKIAAKSVEEVEWNNGALGCPKPDMSYTQVIISGFKIVLEAEGKSYSYHTDRTKRVVLCENTGASGLLKK